MMKSRMGRVGWRECLLAVVGACVLLVVTAVSDARLPV
jgi:hypothetical protein